MGGIAIADPSMGLQHQIWKLTYENSQFILTPQDEGAPVEGPVVYGVSELNLAFDQNMNVFITYVVDGQAWYYWYDPIAAEYLHQIMAPDVINPRCCIDDKRLEMVNTSDIILAYQRGINLYYREQRDRYTIEYLLKMGVNGVLETVGMNKSNRLQFMFLTTLPPAVPPVIDKFGLVNNAAEQGYIDLTAWGFDNFTNYFSPNLLNDPPWSMQKNCQAVEYITYPDGGTPWAMRIINDGGSYNEAYIVQVNTTNGYVSGAVYHRPEYGAFSPNLPFYAGANNALLIASDTGTVSVEKVTL
jgi:hypothetical protein